MGSKLEDRISELEDVLRSVRAVCAREGARTAWKILDKRIEDLGIGSVTAKVFKTPTDGLATEDELESLRLMRDTWNSLLLLPGFNGSGECKTLCELINSVAMIIACRITDRSDPGILFDMASDFSDAETDQ